ncbi:unnamed protein product [Adineta steineri]|uniref:VWFA domain-containing protein n=1 Tax=Adineta steineri TaxID=433720 RepID=A0A816EQQ0_9BILA|nr:unnamed protein product [Adineta steineri]CAF1649379.1 unnamed protein product [Adineta steineri]
MASSLRIEQVDRPVLAQHDSAILDLVFVMDCTGSMGPYIDSAKNNIHAIIEEIVANETSNIRLALIAYRDHPPQDTSFVTCVHDFTTQVNEMKSWLDNFRADGGGDTPEAVADARHDVLHLSWRSDATKICVLISDAPPHGLHQENDSFPNGCPAGHDPARLVRNMAEQHITLYVVGVEPPIVLYRDFFMALAYITGGQYVPMINAKLLAKVIIGGVREEISLDRLMQDALPDIDREMQRAKEDGLDDKIKAQRLNEIFSAKNLRSKRMKNSHGALSSAATDGYAKCPDMAEMRIQFRKQLESTPNTFATSTLTTLASDINYDLMEDVDVSEDQAARLVQKWQQRNKKTYY